MGTRRHYPAPKPKSPTARARKVFLALLLIVLAAVIAYCAIKAAEARTRSWSRHAGHYHSEFCQAVRAEAARRGVTSVGAGVRMARAMGATEDQIARGRACR